MRNKFLYAVVRVLSCLVEKTDLGISVKLNQLSVRRYCMSPHDCVGVLFRES